MVVDSLVGKHGRHLPLWKSKPNTPLSLVTLDIRSSDLTQVVTRFKPDVINHHAALISVTSSMTNPLADANTNIMGTLNVLNAAAKAGTVSQFIFASSGGALYGNVTAPCDEYTPAEPMSPYGLAKATAEQYIGFYRSHFRTTILRYANVYGPRQKIGGETGVIALFAEALTSNKPVTIFGDGYQTRDYVYVGDVAQANVLALGLANHATINIGTSQAVTTRQVFTQLAKATGYQGKPHFAPARAGEIRHSCLAYNRAQKLLGWQPLTSFSTGVDQVVRWLKAEKS